MRHLDFAKQLTLFITLFITLVGGLNGQNGGLEALRKKVADDPDSSSMMAKVCGSNDLNTVDLCRTIFNRAKDKTIKQAAANHMIRRGFREEQYVTFLL